MVDLDDFQYERANYLYANAAYGAAVAAYNFQVELLNEQFPSGWASAFGAPTPVAPEKPAAPPAFNGDSLPAVWPKDSTSVGFPATYYNAGWGAPTAKIHPRLTWSAYGALGQEATGADPSITSLSLTLGKACDPTVTRYLIVTFVPVSIGSGAYNADGSSRKYSFLTGSADLGRSRAAWPALFADLTTPAPTWTALSSEYIKVAVVASAATIAAMTLF